MVYIKDYKDLIVWKKSMVLTKTIYLLCKHIPTSEKFSLISQMQRSAVSVPSNIAEGYGRTTRKDYAHFLHIARGSAAELETQILLTKDLYPNIDTTLALNQVMEVRKILVVLIQKLEAK